MPNISSKLAVDMRVSDAVVAAVAAAAAAAAAEEVGWLGNGDSERFDSLRLISL